ncbi:unnamed protein product, partial [Trichogramma brassicae]
LGADLYILESKHTPVSYTKASTLERADDCLKIAMFHYGEAIISHSSPPVWNIFIFFHSIHRSTPSRFNEQRSDVLSLYTIQCGVRIAKRKILIMFVRNYANAAIRVLFSKVALVSRKRRCTIGKITESRRSHQNKHWSVNCRMPMPSPIYRENFASMYLERYESRKSLTLILPLHADRARIHIARPKVFQKLIFAKYQPRPSSSYSLVSFFPLFPFCQTKYYSRVRVERTSAEAETRRYGDDVFARESEIRKAYTRVAIPRLDKQQQQQQHLALNAARNRATTFNDLRPSAASCVEKKLDGSREPVHSSHFDIAREHYTSITFRVR